jgi:hypothetical protein
MEEKLNSSPDTSRDEMPWENREERFLEALREECIHQYNCHDIAAHSAKCKYTASQLPTIILPLVISTVQPYLVSGYEPVNSAAMLCSGVLAGLSTFFNFGKKMQQHNEFAARYRELADTVTTELAKPRKYRVQLDVFMERCTTKKTQLDREAPML